VSEDKDIVIMFAKERQKTIEQQQEIEKLNNIIKELEKYIGIKMNSFGVCNASDIYFKLQELKGSE